MTQRDFHQLQNQRRETVINEYYYTNSTRKTNSEWHTNGERIKQQLYQQLNKLKVGKEHYEDYFERNEKAI